ncbi:MAG: ABC transporter substrate-binding protein [candidate division NC10 bacterium]|nr:ABC transporter substrate-binding protein [candidate division NC10 bacterium]
MKADAKNVLAVALLACVGLGLFAADGGHAQTRTKIRYALGDVLTTDDLQLLIAAERAKARGVDVEITAFKSEELATQAVINGQADVGQGTPYAAIQKVRIPIRFFYQLYSLLFFPVVNKEAYKSWKDLDGQEIAVHARGSGTEAIVNLVAKQQGIKFKSISYVPGSDVRALGLLRGTLKATILDSNNKNHVMKEAPGKFLILPLGELKASDEALFATRAFLEKNQPAVTILVGELLRVSREINANPRFVAEERKRLGLLKDLPAKLEADITPYFEEAVRSGIIANDGGLASAPKTDLDFFQLSGALKGEKLKTEDFWDLVPLRAAVAKVGK